VDIMNGALGHPAPDHKIMHDYYEKSVAFMKVVEHERSVAVMTVLRQRASSDCLSANGSAVVTMALAQKHDLISLTTSNEFTTERKCVS
jgi:hypothetical protein